MVKVSVAIRDDGSSEIIGSIDDQPMDVRDILDTLMFAAEALREMLRQEM